MKNLSYQKNNLRFFFFSIFLLSLFFNSFAQITTFNDSWRWIKFTTDDGLPSNRVLRITETKNGTVWAATEFGIAWYNGFYWQSISQKDGLPERLPNCIVPDEKDSIYVLMMGKIFYGGQHGFREIPLIINGKKQKAFTIALLNGKLVFTSNEKLYRLENNSSNDFSISHINVDDQKTFWITQTRYSTWLNTNQGLYRWENNNWKLMLNTPPTQLGIFHLVENSTGNGVAFFNHPRDFFGLWEWKTNTKPIKNPKTGITNILALDIYSNNNAILLREPEILEIRNNDNWSMLTSLSTHLHNISLFKFRDNGDLWVGTEIGLFLHRATSKRWEVWKFNIEDLRNNINEIIQAKDGSVWLGTSNGIVIRNTDGQYKTINKILNTNLEVVTGLIEDNLGYIWVSSGSSFEGAFRWNGQHWKYYGPSEGLDAGYIHKIKKDKQGRLWFLGIARKGSGQSNDEQAPGAYVYDYQKFIHWGTKKGLINGYVYSFADASDGSYWFATLGGISQWKSDTLNPSNGKWKHWTEKEGLKQNRIFTLTVDQRNKVWFGDQAFGLGYIENDSVKYFTTSNGLISNAVWDLKADSNNRLWISTRGGVSLYANDTWFNIGSNEGLSNTRVWPILLTENKLFIGTSGGGVEILNLKDINTIPPIAYLIKPLTQGTTLYSYCKAFSFWGEQLSENIEIRYKIDGNKWTPWRKIRQITEPNLPYGSHNLTIQTKGFLGNINTNIKSVSFTIEPPIFFKPIFYLPIVTLFLGLITLGFIFLKKKQKQDLALKKSELRYRTLFERANDPIIIFEPYNETILEVNSKACEVYGFTKEEFIGLSLKKITKDIKRGEEYILKAMEEGEISEFETVHLTKTGQPINFLISASVIEYEGKKAILSLNRDITERKLAEAEKVLLAQTVASAKDAICITDLDNKIIFVNDAFQELYGYSEEEICGQYISLVASPDVSEELQKTIHSTTLEKGQWYGEVTNRRKDGTTFPVELWSSVVYDPENKPVALVGVARDITLRKKLENEQEKLISELKTALAEVNTLSGLLPICSACKKIRDDKGYWREVESYIMKHTSATFTHGLCPECIAKYYPEVAKKINQKEELQ